MKMGIEIKGINEALEMLNPRIHSEIVKNAINDTAKQTKEYAVNTIVSRYNINKSNVNIPLDKAVLTDLSAKLHLSRRPIDLIKLGKAIWQRVWTAARVEVKKGSGRKNVTDKKPNAFIAIMPKTGHTGVFMRIGTYIKGQRQQIQQEVGPSIEQMFKKNIKWFEDFASKTLLSNMTEQVRAMIIKKGSLK